MGNHEENDMPSNTITLTLTQRQIDILYASMQWSIENDKIDTSAEEFDTLLNLLGEQVKDERLVQQP